MLINDIKPSSGEIIINGININESVCFLAFVTSKHSLSLKQRDLEIGFCPQFDWLVVDLTVAETLYLFAR